MRYRIFSYLLSGIVLIGLCPGCDWLPQQTNQRRDIILTKTEQALSAEANRFAFDLFQQVNSEDRNYFISPMSPRLVHDGQRYWRRNGGTNERCAGFRSVFLNNERFLQKISGELKQADQLTEWGLQILSDPGGFPFTKNSKIL